MFLWSDSFCCVDGSYLALEISIELDVPRGHLMSAARSDFLEPFYTLCIDGRWSFSSTAVFSA